MLQRCSVLTQEDNWRRSFCKTGQVGAEGKGPVKRLVSPVTSLLAALVEGRPLKLVCEQMSRWGSAYFYMRIIPQNHCCPYGETFTTYPIKGKGKTREVSLIYLLVPSNYWSIQLEDVHPSYLWDTKAKNRLGMETGSWHPRLSTDKAEPLKAIFNIICECHMFSRKLNLQTNYMFHLQSWWTRNDVYEICQSGGSLPNISSESKLECSWVCGLPCSIAAGFSAGAVLLITCPISI